MTGSRDAAPFAEPVVGFAREVGDAPLAEEVGRDAPRRRLFGDGLRAVLAVFEVRALAVRVGPRAARTVEAVLLVHLQQRLHGARRAHLAPRVLHALDDRRETARGLLPRPRLEAPRELLRRLRARGVRRGPLADVRCALAVRRAVAARPPRPCSRCNATAARRTPSPRSPPSWSNSSPRSSSRTPYEVYFINFTQKPAARAER